MMTVQTEAQSEHLQCVVSEEAVGGEDSATDSDHG